jgi:GNAT superfamily N-acetyltransferase
VSAVSADGPPIVPLTHAHVDAAFGLTQALRWPHRREDWAMVLALGHGVGVVEPDGSLTGTALWWPYGGQAATIGLVIVAGSRQRSGLGRRLMTRVIADASSRATMLNATAAGLRLYQSLGFVETGTVIEQYQGVRGVVPDGVPSPGITVRPFVPSDDPALRAFDALAFGAPRSALLDHLVAKEDIVVAVASGRAGGTCVGYAARRLSGRGHLIGPVTARDEAVAIALVRHHLARLEGFVRLDIPRDAPGLVALLESAGLKPAGPAITMVRGAWAPAAPTARIFGLASQALG